MIYYCFHIKIIIDDRLVYYLLEVVLTPQKSTLGLFLPTFWLGFQEVAASNPQQGGYLDQDLCSIYGYHVPHVRTNKAIDKNECVN